MDRQGELMWPFTLPRLTWLWLWLWLRLWTVRLLCGYCLSAVVVVTPRLHPGLASWGFPFRYHAVPACGACTLACGCYLCLPVPPQCPACTYTCPCT